MLRLTFQFFFIILVVSQTVKSQTCSNLGQTPATAFPICGTDVFAQTSVPVCTNHVIQTFCKAEDGLSYEDKNPYWYKFTCFQSGTLGFLIEPNIGDDDYDWMLFDVTDRDINDVFLDVTTIVAYNWSGEHGNTGASLAGNSLFVCATTGSSGYRPLFSKMPNLVEGHQYLLMISHFLGDQQSGYHLSFGGGTASITDLKDPALQAVSTNCDKTQLRLKLNKKMKCPSLAPDGSDFILTSGSGTIAITQAIAASCTRGFDMDSVLLSLNAPLPAGNYTLTAVNGTDGNTLKDNCDRTIPAGDKLDFSILPPQPTPFDSLVPVRCASNTLQLIFKKGILCNSIAPDGSDFTITGTSPVRIKSASGTCSDGMTSVITIQLLSPIYNKGNFQLLLAPGVDGNTIIDECGFETPAGQTLSFTTKDTVSAAFTYSIDLGCKRDTIHYFHNANNGTNQWTWAFDTTSSSNLQNPSNVYPASGEYTTLLTVSNGFCTDTASAHIVLNNEVTADFEMPDIICPEDSASFKQNSKGPIDRWNWTFGNTRTSTSESPFAEHYPVTGRETYYTVGLTVFSPIGCNESISKKIRVLGSCYIAVPSAFTPNNDGLNDYLYPLGALKADKLSFRVFNRWGQLMFYTNSWLNKWDGTINGTPQSAGVYVWLLEFTNRDSGKKVEMKGTTTLIR